MKHSQPTRASALTASIPVLLFVGWGFFSMAQNKSAGDPEASDPKAVYRALQQKMAVNDSALRHAGNIDGAIRRLEGRLTTHPNDTDGWRVLGWSHFRRQDFGKAADAYRRAADLAAGNAMLKSLYGEALVADAYGQVTPKALAVFQATLKLDPKNIRAGFYAGQAKLQNGDAKSALEMWTDLLKTAPDGAGWAADLRARILEVSRHSGIDQSLSASPPSKSASISGMKPMHAGPTVKDIESASALTPKQRQTMAHEMVERLEKRLNASPNDPDGWIMLIRSRVVLKEPTAAKEALKRATDVFAKKPNIKQRIKLAAKALHISLKE